MLPLVLLLSQTKGPVLPPKAKVKPLTVVARRGMQNDIRKAYAALQRAEMHLKNSPDSLVGAKDRALSLVQQALKELNPKRKVRN